MLLVKCESGAVPTPLCIGMLTAATNPTNGGSGIQKAKQGFYITPSSAGGWETVDRSVNTGHIIKQHVGCSGLNLI